MNFDIIFIVNDVLFKIENKFSRIKMKKCIIPLELKILIIFINVFSCYPSHVKRAKDEDNC